MVFSLYSLSPATCPLTTSSHAIPFLSPSNQRVSGAEELQFPDRQRSYQAEKLRPPKDQGDIQRISSQEGRQLRVLNVPLTATKDDITTLFSSAGTVISVKLLPPKDARETCVSFVTFANAGEATKALEQLDGYLLEGSSLRVLRATERNNARQRSAENDHSNRSQCKSSSYMTNRNGSRQPTLGNSEAMRGNVIGSSERGKSSHWSRNTGIDKSDGHMFNSIDKETVAHDFGQGKHRGAVSYIPPPPAEGEEMIFRGACLQGINFHKYSEIPAKVSGRDAHKAIEDFQGAGLHSVCLRNIAKAGYEKPTPVQKSAIPVILGGRDLMACAQTGSGKTAAFLLPLITLVLNEGFEAVTAGVACPLILVLVPTRELAIQIFEEARKFSFSTGLKCTVAYGGVSVRYQLENLERGCHILVATPGRLADFILRNKVSLEWTKYLVLDEADRMIDVGFGPQICQIMETGNLPPKGQRQTLMFSATFPSLVQEMASDYLDDYIFVAIGIVGGTCTDVTQSVLEIKGSEKRDRLEEILIDSGADRTMVFVQTKRNADFLASFLSQRDFPATSLNGDRTQEEREIALREFTCGKAPVLVATAVAARGLDIPDVKHVINYDLPSHIDEYVHRVGRTGRIGNKGKATSFFDPRSDQGIARALVKVLSEANQVVPSWLEEYALSAVGTNYGPAGGQFSSKDVRNFGKRRSAPRENSEDFNDVHKEGPNCANGRHTNEKKSNTILMQKPLPNSHGTGDSANDQEEDSWD